MRSFRKSSPPKTDLEVALLIGETYADPLAFVQLAYPWSESGEWPAFRGPTAGRASFWRPLETRSAREALMDSTPLRRSA